MAQQQQPTRPAARPPAQQQQANGPREKILRIGIILGGKIVEERLIRKRETVSIGQSAKNTFSIPAPELARSWPLFQVAGGQYVLNVADSMDGRISDGGQVVALAQLKNSGKAQRAGAGWQLPLTDGARGKVILGDLTLLFQFVMAPPLQPRPQLPHSVRGRLADRIDPYLTVVLAISFMLHAGLGAYVYRMDVPRKPEPDEIPDNFPVVKRKAPPPPAAPAPIEVAAGPAEPVEGPAEPVTGEPAGGTKKGPDRGHEGPSAAEIKAARDAQKKQQAAALFRSVTRAGSSGGRHAASNNTVAGDMNKKVTTTATSGGTVAVGGPGTGPGGKRPGGGTVSANTGGKGISGTGTGDDQNTAVQTEKPKIPSTKVKKPLAIPGSGELDPELVYKKISGSYKGGVQKCYIDALKQDEALKGTVTVQFTVTASGGVTGVSAKGVSDGVATCIEGKVKGWTFPAPKKGTPTFRLTFDFAPE